METDPRESRSSFKQDHARLLVLWYHNSDCNDSRNHLSCLQVSEQEPLSKDEKIEILLESLESLRSTLDEAISFIDDSMIEADERG